MTLDDAYELVLEAIASARAKHGTSMEESPFDRKAVILMEEAGEVAMAVNDWDHAPFEDKKRDCVYTKEMAIEEMKEELAQVAATAMRWLTVFE